MNEIVDFMVDAAIAISLVAILAISGSVIVCILTHL